MAEKLEFDLTVKNNDLNKSLKEASVRAGTLSNLFAGGLNPSIEETVETTKRAEKEMSSFVTTTIGVAAGQLAFQLLQSSISFVTSSIRGSIDAFADQEDAINKLKQSFALTGGASESAVDDVLSFASALEATSKYSDDAIIKQVAFVKSLGATTENSKALVQAAANLSATLGGSLEENTDKLGKTLSGTAGRLSQYIPELKNLTEEQLKAGEAARIINEKYSGAAANDLKTYNGQVEALSNSFNNLQESVGDSIVNSGFFTGAMEKIKKLLEDTNANIQANNVFDTYADSQKNASKTSTQLANDTVALDKELISLQKSLEEQNARSSFSKFIFDDDTSGVIKKRIDELTALRSNIEERLSYPSKRTLDVPEPAAVSTQETDSVKKRNSEIFALDQQLALERASFREKELNDIITADLGSQELEIQRIFEFETRKQEIAAQLKQSQIDSGLSVADAELEREKIQKEKQLALLVLYNKKESDLYANKIAFEKKLSDDATKQKITNLGYLNSETQAAFAFGAAIAKDGSKEQFLINKAAALAQAAIAWSTGIANSLLLPPPANLVAEANANRVGALSVATIAAQTIKGFAGGGIVGGEFSGASGGSDNTLITARKDEMMLNAQQQKNLFDMINNGNGNGQPIVVQIDGVEIARAVRSQINGGFRLA